MTLELKISLLSAVAAIASAYWAWSSARSARRSLALSEEEAKNKREAVEPYLIKATRWQGPGGEYVSFSYSYTNASISPTTLGRVELIIHGVDNEGMNSQIRLDPDNGVSRQFDGPYLSLPLNLAPRTTESGWISFKLPEECTRRFFIKEFELVATTWSGSEISLTSHIVIKEPKKHDQPET